MGKGTDKLYITHSEWASTDGSAYSASSGAQKRLTNTGFKRLPFNYCALSLQPFEHPVCTADGTIFDLTNIIPWLKKHGTNPVTGEKLEYNELLKLHMHKNEDGEYMDPVTYKVFTDNTHLAVIKTSGNVYAWDTIERLNIKAKNWKDLITEEEFKRQDIITLQDPKRLQSRDMSTFKYLQEGTSTLSEEQEAERADPLSNINLKATGSTAKILAAKAAVAKARAAKTADPNFNPAVKQVSASLPSAAPKTARGPSRAPIPYNAAIHTTGKAAVSFTSTSFTPHTGSERALLTDEEYMLKPKRVKISGYARIATNLGNLNVELLPEWAPKTVYNFVKLAQKGYYNGVVFHRNIRNFMIQGGDPTGTGRGGTSYWGKNFNDELEGPLKHDARGILSMANKGKNTNSSQFFITYRPVSHLDRKHTIFGKVVGGLDVLDRMETTPTDSSDRPTKDIAIKEIVIFVDPFEEFQKQRKEKEEEERAEALRKQEETEDQKTTWTGKRLRDDGKPQQTSSISVGKYIRDAKLQPAQEDEIVEVVDEPFYEEPLKKKAKSSGGFGNFDSW
ncbi:cyclophilin-like domain-containing protein [Kalaharituber pfeilii]|nr:cyclophilin-like domain-containing protein [Kalaharituber pfeilii]